MPLKALSRAAVLSFAALVLCVSARASVAADPPIRLDGHISEGEWTGAAQHALVGGGEVLAKWVAGDLYLAVRGSDFGWAHVYVAYGDTVLVFHASAALGTATYVRGNTKHWERMAAFEWAVRDTSFTPNAEAARTTFYAEHGWVANTNGMGAIGTLEFRIARHHVRSARLAVLFAEDPARPAYWPRSLTDATLTSDLIRGTAPPRLSFEPLTWGRPPPSE